MTCQIAGHALPLRVYIPVLYTPIKRYPMVIALHGAGVDENSYFDLYSQGKIKQVAEAHEIIVVCPHRQGTTLAEEAECIKAGLREIESRYSIDSSRIYLMGHSAGGSVALHLAAEADFPIAAVASLAGGGFSGLPSPWERIRIPVFLAAATGDEIVPIEFMHRVREAMIGEGVRVEYREISGSDHNQFVAPLFADVFDWFLTHQRKGNDPERDASIRE